MYNACFIINIHLIIRINQEFNSSLEVLTIPEYNKFCIKRYGFRWSQIHLSEFVNQIIQQAKPFQLVKHSPQLKICGSDYHYWLEMTFTSLFKVIGFFRQIVDFDQSATNPYLVAD
jgi:hypothetical protein